MRNRRRQNQMSFKLNKTGSRWKRKKSVKVAGVVMLTNLLPHVTSDDIRQIFMAEGTVTQAFTNYDAKTGKSSCTAEVHYANKNDARKAQQKLNGATIDGKPVTVRLKT